MNLTQIMNITLPDPPAARMHESFPKVSPKLISRDHFEREGHMVHVIIPDGPPNFFRFTKQQFELVMLFDGRRSYGEIAATFTRTQGVGIKEDLVRTFAENMEKMQFWYRTPQEESITLFNKLAGDRHQTVQRKYSKSSGDLSIIELAYFDPDKYLTWIHNKLSFVYGTWFNVFALIMVVVMCCILGARWDEVWADSVKFYNLSEKGFLDFIEFFAIFVVLGVAHETAHGMTCKHYGGESHKMGAFLMYLLPGVFCDVTQIYIYGGRWQRIATVFAGVWSEIVICTWVTVVWWFTQPGTRIHDLAYKFILSGGIFVLIINLNPLSRMDGYYIFCELTRFFDLKGNSTALLSSWVRKNIFRMKVTVPAMPWRRKLFFFAYAILGGMYSYLMLAFLARISYRIFYNYSPEWAFVPASLIGYKIFKSRIEKLMAFLKALYLDKRELMSAHWKVVAAAAAALIILGSIPVWRESFDQRFVLEAKQQSVLRASVPGTVISVSADEGEHVLAGQPIAVLRDLQVETDAARTAAEYGQAEAHAVQAALKYTGYAEAVEERQRLQKLARQIEERQRQLSIESPIAGMVTTPHVHDLVGSYVLPGTVIAVVADTSRMRAEIFVQEDELQKLEKIDRAILRMDAKWKPTRAEFESLSPDSRELEKGLIPPSKFKGMKPPIYYVLKMSVANDGGELRPGMAGTARIYGRRRSTMAVVFRPVIDSVMRRFW